ncbi:OmpA family protein [bacterium]|jgi:chemotaxis protein MotB|nr:OmpA family protein [bacterium]
MALRKLFKKDDTEETARLIKKADASSHLSSPDHDESNWLVSYADMMTLLCGFFIMMFSMAKLDEPQYERVKESVAKTFGGEYKSPTNELAKFVTNVLQEAGIEKEVSVRSGPGGVAMIFQSTVLFDTLSADVKPQGQIILNKLIESLATRQHAEQKNYKVVVEGHTDNRPIVGGTFPSNWELSGGRASRVVRMFLDKGFNPALLTSIGYADTRPAEKKTQLPNGLWDEAALAKNRRVVVRVLEPKMDSIPFPESGNITETSEAPKINPQNASH